MSFLGESFGVRVPFEGLMLQGLGLRVEGSDLKGLEVVLGLRVEDLRWTLGAIRN